MLSRSIVVRLLTPLVVMVVLLIGMQRLDEYVRTRVIAAQTAVTQALTSAPLSESATSLQR